MVSTLQGGKQKNLTNTENNFSILYIFMKYSKIICNTDRHVCVIHRNFKEQLIYL